VTEGRPRVAQQALGVAAADDALLSSGSQASGRTSATGCSRDPARLDCPEERRVARLNGARFWNATDACCDVDASGVDDSSYLAGLINEIGSHVAVDPRRVFVVGHSNGAFMSYRMACDHADTIAAIVSLAGAPPADPAACRPTEPVAILRTTDPLSPRVRRRLARRRA
jgi:polyhydroxybutyrate depolymerase